MHSKDTFFSLHRQGFVRVAACTPDGACNESSDMVAFSVAPRFYQHGWFLPLCLFGSALVGGAMYQLRIRRLKEHFDLVLAERGRIARELHDTLLQGFSGITMAMQAMASRLPRSSSERQTLEDIVADAGDAIHDIEIAFSRRQRHHRCIAQSALVHYERQALLHPAQVSLPFGKAPGQPFDVAAIVGVVADIQIVGDS